MGFVTLFGVAFPLASTLALANNYFEVFVDYNKLLSDTRENISRSSKSIDSIQLFLQVLLALSVVTNAWLFAFRSDGGREVYGLENALKFGAFCTLVFLLQFAVFVAINDTPSDVLKLAKRHASVRSSILNREKPAVEKPSYHRLTTADTQDSSQF